VAAVKPAPGTPVPAASATLAFSPATVTVRRGRARFTPRVRVGGRQVKRRLALRVGRRILYVRSGNAVTIRTGSARRIVVTFTYRGKQRRRVITLMRP
jgi:hypothetical protein